MQFPAQYFYKHSPSASLSGSEEPHGDAFQWEKFDDLFDQVFSTTSKSSPSATTDGDYVPMPGPTPRAYLRRMTSSGGESSASDDSVAGDLFERAWDDAVRKTNKTITTTTKRRIIRHTPPAASAATPIATPPAPSRLQIPAPVPARLKYPRTPYPRQSLGLEEESSGENSDSSEGKPRAAPRGSAAPPTPSRVASLKIPETGLTPELHSPVLWKPKRRTSTEWQTTVFEMPDGLTKEDIHVAFTNTPGGEKITVSWQHTEISEIMEAGKLVRERKERKYMRTLPLPRGVKFEHVQANLSDSALTITHPKSAPDANFGRPRQVEVLQLRR